MQKLATVWSLKSRYFFHIGLMHVQMIRKNLNDVQVHSIKVVLLLSYKNALTVVMRVRSS